MIRVSLHRLRGDNRPWAALVLMLAGLTWMPGCGQSSSTSPQPPVKRGPTSQTNVQDELFRTVADNLERLPDFEPRQILTQIRDRLNQWVQQANPQIEWKPDPLIGTLPKELQQIAEYRLDELDFSDSDVRLLQESVWLRDISMTARRGNLQDIELAAGLFDWTIRNVQLLAEPDDPGRFYQGPTQILLLGRGRAAERGWIFMLLARQQGLEPVMLAVPGESATDAQYWLPAVLSEGQLYLFDPRLGLPIPGPDGKGIATFEQATSDETLLRKLDLDEEHRYPLTAERLKSAAAYVEASPGYLTKRMKLVESHLSGAQRIVLSAAPSALAKRVQDLGQVAETGLWQLPYQVIKNQSGLDQRGQRAVADELVHLNFSPQLFKGRTLQFKGTYDGPKGAKREFLAARPSKAQLDAVQIDTRVRDGLETAKQYASLWLGLIAFEQEDYPVAIDYFGKRSLEESPDSSLADAARYNLARSYEAHREPDRAVALYRSDTSPQSHGNKLRARSLAQVAKPEVKADAQP